MRVAFQYMSCSLNFKRGDRGDFVGESRGIANGDTRSIDYGSHVAFQKMWRMHLVRLCVFPPLIVADEWLAPGGHSFIHSFIHSFLHSFIHS